MYFHHIFGWNVKTRNKKSVSKQQYAKIIELKRTHPKRFVQFFSCLALFHSELVCFNRHFQISIRHWARFQFVNRLYHVLNFLSSSIFPLRMCVCVCVLRLYKWSALSTRIFESVWIAFDTFLFTRCMYLFQWIICEWKVNEWKHISKLCTRLHFKCETFLYFQ